MQENLFFFLHSLDITNLAMRYKTICKPWLGFLVTQLILNRMSAPSSLVLKICIACTVLIRLSGNTREIYEIQIQSPPKKKKNKLKPILTTLQSFWSIRQVLFDIEVWCNFKYCYSFRCPKANFVLQFFHV